MRAHVFTDASLAEHAGRFAWLSIDVEEAQNAAFLQRFPWQAIPAFLVIDPANESVAYKWLGTADVAQLIRRLGDAERAVRGSAGDPASTAIAEADRLYGADKKQEAASAYQRAIDAGGPNWPDRPRAVEAMVTALSLSDKAETCATVAGREAPALPRGSAFASIVATGLSCALDAESSSSWRTPAITALEPLVHEALALPDLLGDDRSGLYMTLVQAREAAGDEAGMKKLAGEWLDFLERATASAKNAEERLAYDSHRVSAALAVGTPERALPALQASARDLPGDYNPPARMAVILREMGRYDEALAASDRALAMAYGPRKIGIYEARAAIYEKMGDIAAVKQTLLDAIDFARTLPPSSRIEQTIERLEKRRGTVG